MIGESEEDKQWRTPPKRVPLDRETPWMYSGKQSTGKHMGTPKSRKDEIDLLKKVCRDEPVTLPGDPKSNPGLRRFVPVFKHPLPLSVDRPLHEKQLRRVLCMSLHKQAQAAATLGNGWVLEEVYMRGAPVHLADRTGFTPLHMAVNNNNFEAIMVLLNIGKEGKVDINAITTSGITPLFLAKSTGAMEAMKLLEEQGARMHAEPKSVAPGHTILDLQKHTKSSVIEAQTRYIGMPRSFELL